MPSFKFIGAYPRFYPQERDANGQSLMAELGMVVEFSEPPNDGQWIPVEGAQETPPRAPEAPPANPEPAREVPALAPESEPAPVPAEPSVADPTPAPAVPQAAPFVFPGFAQPASPFTR